MIRLVADGNMSHRFVTACLRLDPDFPIIHLAAWLGGKHRMSKDPVLLSVLREYGLIVAGFDRRSMAMPGVILFRRSVSQMDYGKQSRLLVEFWREAADWDWTDRIQYLPGEN